MYADPWESVVLDSQLMSVSKCYRYQCHSFECTGLNHCGHKEGTWGGPEHRNTAKN